MKEKIYVHDIPGRLRVRAEAIRNDERARVAVERTLRNAPGVTSATVNPLAGSTLVTYETGKITSAEILALLRRTGLIGAETKTVQAASNPATLNRVTRNVLANGARIALDWTLEHLLEAALAAVV